MRRQHPIFSRRRFLQDRARDGGGLKEIVWLTPDGTEMTESEWQQEFARCLGVYLAGGGDRAASTGAARPSRTTNFLLLFNAHHEPIAFTLPQLPPASAWSTVLDTARDGATVRAAALSSRAATYPLQGRSLALLRRDDS